MNEFGVFATSSSARLIAPFMPSVFGVRVTSAPGEGATVHLSFDRAVECVGSARA